MKRQFIIGTRGSQLALWQTDFVKTELEKRFPELSLAVRVIKTTGDKILDTSLSKIGDKGLFTKQIETSLLDNEIDLAVHSLKDLQTIQPAGLCIGAVTKRELPNDVLISNKYVAIDELPKGAKVATGSLRRKSQLLNYRPDLEIFEIRGNLQTRFQKFDDSDLDAMILAFAGVHRLKMDDRISQIIPFEIMLPAVGQGALAIEIREEDAELRGILQVLNDQETFACVIAERAFLRSLEGGCQVPIGAHALIKNGEIILEGLVGSLNGKINLRGKIVGAKTDAKSLGEKLARILIEKGANEILERTREKVENSANEVI